MIDPSRREFLIRASAGAAAIAVAASQVAGGATSTGDEPMTDIQAFAPVQPRSLSFDPAKLNGLSEKLIRSHWENNYGGSVKTLNAVKQKLAAALADKETPPFVYGDLKREHLMRANSVELHELYFDNLGGNGGVDIATRKALDAVFGSYDAWEAEFRKIAASLAGGSGWVVTGYSLHGGTIENYWLPDHLHFPASNAPLLVMDMYEHSYHMDYGAAAARYIDAFMQNVRWEEVAERLGRARAWKPGSR